MTLLILLICITSLNIANCLRGCFELPSNASSGFYTIQYTGENGILLNATNYCMMDYGGGWTLIARSFNIPKGPIFGWTSHSNTNLMCGNTWYEGDFF